MPATWMYVALNNQKPGTPLGMYSSWITDYLDAYNKRNVPFIVSMLRYINPLCLPRLAELVETKDQH